MLPAYTSTLIKYI